MTAATRDIADALGRLDAERDRLLRRLAEIDATHGALEIALDVMTRAYEAGESLPKIAPKSVRNTLVVILREKGEPMHYLELTAELGRRDVAIGGKNKGNTVGAHLSNDPRIVPLGRGRWGLKSWGLV